MIEYNEGPPLFGVAQLAELARNFDPLTPGELKRVIFVRWRLRAGHLTGDGPVPSWEPLRDGKRL